MHVYFINCFNAKLYLETLPLAPTDCEIYGIRCDDVASMLQRHNFQFRLGRDTADCVSSGRLRKVKNNRKLSIISKSGRLLEVVAYERFHL